VTTPRLLGVVGLSLVVLVLGDGLPWLFPAFCLIALLAIGELWLRALAGEAVPAVARLGLAATSGLITLPLVAIVLYWSHVPIAAHALAAGMAVVTAGLGVVVLLRERSGRPPADPRLARTMVAVAIPLGLAAAVGGTAVLAYAKLPHPPQPGYTSLALNGWAAGIDRPVAIGARGIQVPVRVSSMGEPAGTAALRVRVGDRLTNARPIEITADTTRTVEIYIPAPPDGCLHRIEISLGAASTVFYAHGPAAC
jgi:hypothetical protein